MFITQAQLELPACYQTEEPSFWIEEHISGQLLQAHLDPDFEGASRTRAYMERSAAWIIGQIPPATYPKLLDLGCGPGLYAERFCRASYQVTGVDFSKRSISWAQASAQQQDLPITYLCQDYLTLSQTALYDATVLLYCDYGALSTDQRRLLIHKISQTLRPGGLLLLDVFTHHAYKAFREEQTWQSYPCGGFWKEGPHLVLQRNLAYPHHVTLEQSIVLDEKSTRIYNIWNTYFTLDRLREETEAAGLTLNAAYGDLCGSPYTGGSKTLAVVFQKQ